MPQSERAGGFEVGPLLTLVERWAKARNMHLAHAASINDDEDEWLAEDDDLMAREYGQRATELHTLLASLLGTQDPTTRQGGGDD